MTSNYYQRLHNDNPAYQNNNWLLEKSEEILNQKPKFLLEIGFGNGKFLIEASKTISEIWKKL